MSLIDKFRTSVLASCWAGILAKVFFLFILAINTRFVMDEFWQFGETQYLGHGLFDTIWPGKAVGYALFYKPAHLIGWNASSMLLAGRLETALLGCATLLIVYALARAIGHDRTRALVIVLLLLSFSTFMERIFRTRSEPLALFFAAAALLVIAQGSPDSWRRLLGAGVLSGLSFLSTQKAVYFDVALGLALLTDAAVVRRYSNGVRRGALLVAGWIVPIIAYCVVFGGTNPMAVGANLFFGPMELATQGGTYYTGLQQFIYQTLSRNAPLYLLCVLGAALAFRRFRTLADSQRIVLVFTVLITALVFTHNQPWPYIFIMAIPFLALWGLGLYEILSINRVKIALTGILVLIVAVSFWRNVRYLKLDNTRQLAVIAAAEQLLPKNGAYFDGIGMLPSRRNSPRIWLDAHQIYLTKIAGRKSKLYREFLNSPPDLIISSYRTEALQSLLRPLLQPRYYPVSTNIMLPGRSIPAGEAVTFDVPVAGQYGIYDRTGAPLDGRIQVDGTWRNLPVRLDAKAHTLFTDIGRAPLFILPARLSLGPLDPPATPVPLFAGVYTF